jgi:hypothetical protein
MEPTVVVHVSKPIDLETGRLTPDTAWEVPLCIASGLLSEVLACLCVPGETPATATAANYDQASIVRWVNRHLTLRDLGAGTGVSKAMLSQVLHGKKQLSKERLTALLGAYGTWVREHGCAETSETR